MQMLFKDGRPGLNAIDDHNYGFIVAQVLKFSRIVTRHGGVSTRFVEGIEKWRDTHDYPLKLGTKTVSGSRMELHGLVSIAQRVSCNVWYTNLASRMAHKCKLKLYRKNSVAERE